MEQMMMEEIPFSLNYNALKMFGRQLYSNAWAAISELVANGFDAGAENVYLYIDMRDKARALIELFDNGAGMSLEELKQKYVKIGRNRRNEIVNDTAAGRKGIGKLAALYLSNSYQIIVKKEGEIGAWSVDVSNLDDEAVPSLQPVNSNDIEFKCKEVWDNFPSGTMIRLEDVNLNRIGDAAIDALKHKLSNYFLFNSIENRLKICVIRSDDDTFDFETTNKKIAFDNMSSIYTTNSELVETTKDTLELTYQNKLKETKTAVRAISIKPLPNKVINPKTSIEYQTKGSLIVEEKVKEYVLTGWIGIHSSINKAEAEKNDSRYVKNQFYNPNQIRVYVRGKLFSDNILSTLPLVGAFVNYIEGEVSFEILDENDLDDIATSNRQDFSFIDERVKLLKELLSGICRQLLSDRQKLADDIKEITEDENRKIQSREKSAFTHDVYEELSSIETFPKEKIDEWTTIIANKLKGEYDLKTSFKLFLSHAGKDRIFTDFISMYLKKRGFILDLTDVEKTEIFYSSDGLDIDNLDPLATIIKNMIVRDNTQILFLTSKNFLKSQYCLFEGGAAWATRSIGEYGIVSLDYDSIPKFLTNGKTEFSFNLEDRNSFILNRQSYQNIVKILNRAIAHLNKNRAIIKRPIIELIPEPYFDDEVDMREKGKTEKDYMDPIVLRYWEVYVEGKIDEYLRNNQEQDYC